MTLDAATLVAILDGWPQGYREGAYGGERWGATLTRSEGGARISLFARRLAGGDFVSGNFYRLASGPAARPCEMPLEKLARFIVGFAPEAG